jgi:acetyl esterase/lipase
MRIAAASGVVLLLSRIALGQQASQEIPLYGALPTLNNAPAEITQSFNGNNLIRNVTQPTLTAFLPSKEKATGAAVIVAPGGAFMWLSIDDGRELALWLADHGIAAFVLKYRLNVTPANTTAFAHAVTEHFAQIGKGGSRPNPDLPLATADGKAAVKLIRDRAREWNLDPARIGFLGFSAGAIVAVQMAIADNKSDRPNFVAPISGSMGKVDVPPDAPPLFVAMGANDPIFGGKGFGLVDAWIAAKRPAELHMFAKGGHDIDMEKQGFTSDHWTEEFYWWMQASGFLTSRPTSDIPR